MERDDRPTVATFHVAAAFALGQTTALGESAAHHARVKRLERGDRVRLTDGKGKIALGAIDAMSRTEVEIMVDDISERARPASIHVRVPIGDRDRMIWLAEKATELGVESWQAIRFRRSLNVTPRGEGTQFTEKVRARMISALEQSGGAWLPQVLHEAAPAEIDIPPRADTLLLDAAGQPMLSLARPGPTVLIFGPEGGLDPDERQFLVVAGWRPARLADDTLRFETAGIAAISVIRAVHLHGEY